jgi:hypothetical protein
MYRVLKPSRKIGKMSAPNLEQEMNETFRNDDHLRALCLGSIPIKEYIKN